MRSLGTKKFFLENAEPQKLCTKSIREDKALLANSYADLVEIIAKLTYHNPGYAFFYRGQEQDHENDAGASSLYPEIFRKNGKTLSCVEIDSRFDFLDKSTQSFIGYLKEHDLGHWRKMQKFPELAWAVLQHYKVCATPLLDITHSLRVACSFALPDDKKNKSGCVYVLALPPPSEALYESEYEELKILNLLNVCPPVAKRPHFQEGWMLCTNPPGYARKIHPSLDAGVRLVGKFEIPRHGFWSKEFPCFSKAALMPSDDAMLDICKKIINDLDSMP